MSNPLEPSPHPVEQPDAATSSDLAVQVAALSAEVAELRAKQARAGLRPLEVVLIVLLGVSLLVHALTVSQLLRVRGTLRDEIAQLAERVTEAKSQQVRYSLPIDQQVPINVDVPIKRVLDVPIRLDVPIKQTITVPIDTGLGQVNLPVALDTTVPISTTVPIAFDQTLNISTTVPIRLDVPLQVDLGSAQLAPYLDRLRQKLLELRDSL